MQFRGLGVWWAWVPERQWNPTQSPEGQSFCRMSLGLHIVRGRDSEDTEPLGHPDQPEPSTLSPFLLDEKGAKP